MNNRENLKKIKIVTHSGNFHADEVFACAVISLFHTGEVEIVRSRDPKVWTTGDYVVDVGLEYDPMRGRFDHHQSGGSGVRQNGTPYSSFGLVWKEFGEKISGSSYAAMAIDRHLVQPIDAGDSGVEIFKINGDVAPYLLQDTISAFRPGWNEHRSEDEGFFDAYEFAKQVLLREVVRARGEEEGIARARDAYAKAEDKRIVVLDDHYPWYEALGGRPEPLYVVKPDRGGEGKWKVEAVRDDVHSFKNRKNLPATWAGKVGPELATITGVSDALFCHNGLFVAIAGSKEGAIKLANLAVEA